MRKILKMGFCGMAVCMMLAGCSGKKDEMTKETQAEHTTEESTEAYVEKGTIELGEYKKVPVKVVTPKVTEEEVDQQIQRALEAGVKYIEKEDKTAELGDMVTIDYKGLLNGEAFEGGTDEGYDLLLGSHQFIDGFEDGLVGVKKGDKRDLNLTFPENYGSKELAGKDVVFEVTVHAVKVKQLPELNEEFVAAYSPDDKTVEDFRNTMREQILMQKQIQIDNQRDIDLMNTIIANSEIVCATADIDREYNEQMDYLTQMVAMYGIDLETYAQMNGTDEAGLKKEVRTQATVLAKQRMILNEIAAKENITVNDEDRDKLGEQSYYGTKEDLIEAVGQEKVDEAALVQKTLDFIVANAEVTVENAE